MEAQKSEDIDEIQVYKEIGEKLGISIVRLGYKPKDMFLKKYDLSEEQRKATLLYDFDNQVIRYTMYMNDKDSSLGQIETDQLIDEYQIETAQKIIVEIKEYKIKDSELNRYVADFEYMDAQYQFMGVIEKEEFERIIKNLAFL